MSVDVSSLVGGVPSAFDFDSQAGILFVLKAIRLSESGQLEKNKLKDLVFLYNTGGKDPAVRSQLEEYLNTEKITPQVVVDAEAALAAVQLAATKKVPVPGFSSGRLVPSFGAAVLPVAPSVAKQPPVVPVRTQRAVDPIQPSDTSTVSFVPIRRVDTVAAHVIHPTIPEASVVPVIEEMPVVATPAPQVIKSIEPANIELPIKEKTDTVIPPAPEVAPLVVPDVLQKNAEIRMERIRTIKAAVNERVGNPVNLVDVDNTLGREYMSALLEAMKLLSSAGEAESEKAMSRLEAVFVAVIKLLDEVQAKLAAPVVSAPEAVASVSEISVPVTQSLDQPAVEVVEPVRPVVVLPTDFSARSKVTDKQGSPSTVSGWDVPSVTQPLSPIEKMVSVAEAVTPPIAPTDVRFSTPPAEPIQTHVVVPLPNAVPESVRSIVEEVPPLRSISELKTADEVSSIEAMGNNPLYTKDVDAGLEQLLGEWSIFKKSGLFGTGPKGREHPLYVKLSTLQVPLILSGRFEGGSQEIKQSITDYMNGWRYEQGIIYEANETLDEYLRRVIRHIIDLQKTKRRS